MYIQSAVRHLIGAAFLGVALAPCMALAQAKVEVTNAWARATAPAQKVGAVYLDVRSATAARLISAASPVAAKTELHNMTMENNVMKMQPVDAISLPAGQSVKLAPGGYHVMLIDLKRELKKGDTVPVTLTVEQSDKTRQTIEVKAEVRDMTGGHMAK
jgi:copper(I)-binding protein